MECSSSPANQLGLSLQELLLEHSCARRRLLPARLLLDLLPPSFTNEALFDKSQLDRCTDTTARGARGDDEATLVQAALLFAEQGYCVKKRAGLGTWPHGRPSAQPRR
eukprot:GAFH01004053.1.p4 GENE.GAFH01004053.1~~GAFH01004053.1.p4  ORF type:complete len:108 (+),score=14.73 GAFH01004053.1:409-732(+)